MFYLLIKGNFASTQRQPRAPLVSHFKGNFGRYFAWSSLTSWHFFRNSHRSFIIPKTFVWFYAASKSQPKLIAFKRRPCELQNLHRCFRASPRDYLLVPGSYVIKAERKTLFCRNDGIWQHQMFLVHPTLVISLFDYYLNYSQVVCETMTCFQHTLKNWYSMILHRFYAHNEHVIFTSIHCKWKNIANEKLF